MNDRQRGFYFGEVLPAIAEGIDRLLDADGQSLALWSKDKTHAHCKAAFGIQTTQGMTISDAADYLTFLQAFAAECLIFVATPEEWLKGESELARMAHYDYVLDRPALQEAA